MDLQQHDVTMTSFLANLSESLESFVVTLCKTDVERAPESLVTIYVMFKGNSSPLTWDFKLR